MGRMKRPSFVPMVCYSLRAMKVTNVGQRSHIVMGRTQESESTESQPLVVGILGNFIVISLKLNFLYS